MNIGSKMYAHDDASGNRLFLRVFFDENKVNTNADLYLKLKSEGRARQLGSLDLSTKTFWCKRNTSKHYHYATKSFGFNWTILQDDFLDIQKVRLVVDDEIHYEFPISLIKDYGRFLNFKQQGFELQRFLSYELIKNYKVNDIQRRNVVENDKE